MGRVVILAACGLTWPLISTVAWLNALTGIAEIVLGFAGYTPGLLAASRADTAVERAYVAAIGLSGFASLYSLYVGSRVLFLVSLLASAFLRHIALVLAAAALRVALNVDASFVLHAVIAWLALYAAGAAVHGCWRVR